MTDLDEMLDLVRAAETQAKARRRSRGKSQLSHAAKIQLLRDRGWVHMPGSDRWMDGSGKAMSLDAAITVQQRRDQR